MMFRFKAIFMIRLNQFSNKIRSERRELKLSLCERLVSKNDCVSKEKKSEKI